MRVYLIRELQAGAHVVIPSVVLAECATGTTLDAKLNAFIKPYPVHIVDEHIARAAAKLRHACRLRWGDTIDAIVVAIADLEVASVLLTSDRDDLTRLAAERGLSRVIRI